MKGKTTSTEVEAAGALDEARSSAIESFGLRAKREGGIGRRDWPLPS